MYSLGLYWPQFQQSAGTMPLSSLSVHIINSLVCIQNVISDVILFKINVRVRYL
jgi:hypothetical protein